MKLAPPESPSWNYLEMTTIGNYEKMLRYPENCSNFYCAVVKWYKYTNLYVISRWEACTTPKPCYNDPFNNKIPAIKILTLSTSVVNFILKPPWNNKTPAIKKKSWVSPDSINRGFSVCIPLETNGLGMRGNKCKYKISTKLLWISTCKNSDYF